MSKRAITRPPGRSYAKCISSHPEHHLVSTKKALEQHNEYTHTLEELGLEVIQLDAQDEMPDSCFVEDTSVVVGSRALVTRPRFPSRQIEVATIEEILGNYFSIERIQTPGTLEGGDVIHVEDRLISGLTERSNLEGVMQMRRKLDIQVDTVEDREIIHLKSYVTYLERGVLIGTRRFADNEAFIGLDYNAIPDREGYAANTLTVNGTVILPKGYPVTTKVIKELGYETVSLDTSEFARCEGALTCLSIIF